MKKSNHEVIDLKEKYFVFLVRRFYFQVEANDRGSELTLTLPNRAITPRVSCSSYAGEETKASHLSLSLPRAASLCSVMNG